MEIGLAYATKTNHSMKIAESIADELKIEAKNVKDHPVYSNVDLLILVGGIYGGESLPEMIEYVRALTPAQVKKVVLVTSCVSKKKYQESVRKELARNDVKIMDEFICQGNFLFVGMGHPDKKDIADAVAFVKESVAKLEVQSN